MLDYDQIFGLFIPDTTFGFGAVSVLGQKIKALGGRKPLIISDAGVVAAGLLEPVEKVLKSEKLEYGLFTDCLPDAPFRVVSSCIECILKDGYDLLVGVGGGSILDTTKAASVVAVENRPITEYIGAGKVKKPGLPKIYIPTTAGSGAEWTPAANVTDDADREKLIKVFVSSTYLRPDAVIVDAGMTLNLPARITAVTGIDALSHGIESFTSWRSSPVSDMLSSTCIRLVAENLRGAYGQGSNNRRARYNMSIAASLGFTWSVSGGGIVHGMSYPLQMASHVSHGEAIAILLPHVMKFNMMADIDKFAQLGLLMDGDLRGLSRREQALLGIESVSSLIADVGLPQRMRDIDVKREEIPAFVETVFTNSQNLIGLNCRRPSKAEMTAIFEAAW